MFLNTQNTTWDNHERIIGFSNQLSKRQLESGVISTIVFDEILQFYNGEHDAPYLNKDPRACLTLPIWAKYLSHRPAIVFTYRHPLEVAMSLKKRDNFPLSKGLKLWITYNVRTLQYTTGYCLVVTNVNAIIHNTLEEMQRVSDELLKTCHVLSPPNKILTNSVVEGFVDVSLQHNTNGDTEQINATLTPLKDFGNRCIAQHLKSDYPEESSQRIVEVDAYLLAMQLYCDFESGIAFDEEYVLPDLSTLNDAPKLRSQ